MVTGLDLETAGNRFSRGEDRGSDPWMEIGIPVPEDAVDADGGGNSGGGGREKEGSEPGNKSFLILIKPGKHSPVLLDDPRSFRPVLFREQQHALAVVIVRDCRPFPRSGCLRKRDERRQRERDRGILRHRLRKAVAAGLIKREKELCDVATSREAAFPRLSGADTRTRRR